MKSVFKLCVVVAMVPWVSAVYAGGRGDQGPESSNGGNKAFAKHFPEHDSSFSVGQFALGIGEFVAGGAVLAHSLDLVEDFQKKANTLVHLKNQIRDLELSPSTDEQKKLLIQRADADLKNAVNELETLQSRGTGRQDLLVRSKAAKALDDAEKKVMSVRELNVVSPESLKSRLLVKRTEIIKAQEEFEQLAGRRARLGNRLGRGLMAAGGVYLLLDVGTRVYVRTSLDARAGWSPLATIALGEATDVAKSMVSNRPATVSKDYEDGYQRGVFGHGISSNEEENSEYRQGYRAGLQKFMSGSGR